MHYFHIIPNYAYHLTHLTLLKKTEDCNECKTIFYVVGSYKRKKKSL